MFLLRIVGLLAALAIGIGIVAYLFTGRRAYLVLAGRVVKYALIFALMMFGLLIAERILVMV
jgi:hypothetical protein